MASGAETRRVLNALIKYKNLWFAYYKCRRQAAYTQCILVYIHRVSHTGCPQTISVIYGGAKQLFTLFITFFLAYVMFNPCLKYKQNVLPIFLTPSLSSFSLSLSLCLSVPKIIWKIYLNAVFRYIDKVCPVKCSQSQQWGFLFSSLPAPNATQQKATHRHTHPHRAWLVLVYYIYTALYI